MQAIFHQRFVRRAMNVPLVCLTLLCAALTPLGSGQTTTYCTGAGHESPSAPHSISCVIVTPIQTTPSQLPNSLPSVAVDWHYDPQQEMLILHLVNNSDKDITAYNVSISSRYANRSSGNVDGSPSHSERMEDMLGAFIFQQMPAPDGERRENGTFAPGTSKYQQIPEPKDIFDVTAVVDVVVYADATAEVQNERAFRELLAERCGPLLAIKTVDEAIRHALENQTATSPISATLDELTARFVNVVGKNPLPQDPERYLESQLPDDIQNLKMAQQAKTMTSERDYLTRYVEEQEKEYALRAPHCQVRVLNK